MNIQELYDIYKKHPVICTDTRKITAGCLYFALKGEHFDGNTFALQALGTGAAYAIIDNVSLKTEERTVLVDDALTTLQELANYHRKQLSIPFIGITGSNGKTTTKELIRSVLSVKYNTYATQGNLNNHIGVPLTILSIDQNVEMAIIEMGANHQQEIASLCKIAEPGFGVITNVGKAHLEGFGGFEGVKKGKGELYDFLCQNNGLAFVNEDSTHLYKMVTERALKNVVYYSTNADSNLRGEIVEYDPFLTIDWISDQERHRVRTHLTGPYNLENILAAIAVGKHFGLSPSEINQGISSYKPGNNRSQITKTESNTLICDYYNANPSSMAAALDNFSAISAEKKVLILGDMFELGDEAIKEHQHLVQKALSLKTDQVFFIGRNFFANKTDNALFFETTDDALKYLDSHAIDSATILVKGSRSMHLERVVEVL